MLKPIQIAIIDDGIDEKQFDIGELNHNIEINRKLEIQPRMVSSPYQKSHGTICAAIIRKYLPDVQLSSVKILNENWTSTRDQFVKAIEWCVVNKIKLINISLGTVEYNDFCLLYRCIKYAYGNGVIIVAACSNDNRYTCPASLEYAIGVKCDLTGRLLEDEYIYNPFPLDGIEFTANSLHVIYNNQNAQFTSFGNSYAAPLITCLVYKMLSKNPNLSLLEIKKELIKNAANNKYDNNVILYQNQIKDAIDIPFIAVYDFHRGPAILFAEKLCELFREKGYYAVSVIDKIRKSTAHQGIIAYEEYCNKSGKDNVFVTRKIYNVFKCDVLISFITMLGSNTRLYDELKHMNSNEIDIIIMIIDEFTSDVEKNIIENNDKEVLIFSTTKINVDKKRIKIFYSIHEIFYYVVRMLTKTAV